MLAIKRPCTNDARTAVIRTRRESNFSALAIFRGRNVWTVRDI